MRLGRWTVDLEQRTLSDQEQSKTLTPRSWDVLIHLLEHRGELVRTETLLARFWRGGLSEEAYVRKSIGEIRSALGDSISTPTFIRTVRKQGYVFLAGEDADNRSSSKSAHTIAVLPLTNMSSDEENQHFCDGLTEEILHRLTQQAHSPILARTSTAQFRNAGQDIREIGRSLHATHILEGSVRKAADSVRITAQFIDATTGTHLWSQTYQRKLDNIFSVQDEIASLVSLQIRRSIDEEINAPDKALRTVFFSRKFTSPNDFKRMTQAIEKLSTTQQ